MPLKRYALFAFDDHYPGGGWGDFEESFDTVEEVARVIAGPRGYEKDQRRHFDNYQVIDLVTGEEVDWEGRG
jgi:hypothetical protein